MYAAFLQQQNLYRPISQTVFMLSIAINRAEHVCATVIIKHNYMQNENESVWAIITLKDLSKLVIGSFYRPPDKGIQPLVDLEMELAQISEKFKNNSHFGR